MPNPNQRFKGQPDERRIVLDKLDNATLAQIEDSRNFWRIECDCGTFHKARPGTAKWCEHAQNLLKAHGDVKDDRLLDPQVRVIVIINPALEAYFTLDNPDENGFRQVMLVVPDMTSPAEATRFFQKKPMGLIHVNSGRLELRSLMLDWLFGLTAEGLACRSMIHNPGGSPYENEEEHVTQRGNPGFPVLVDLYDLYTTGNCRRCNEDSGIPDV